MVNPLDINSEVTHGNLGLEKVLKGLAVEQGLSKNYGHTYFCLKATGSTFTGSYGSFYDRFQTVLDNGNNRIQSNLTTTLALLEHGDKVYLGPGDWTGNYTTPANTVARDVSIIAMNAGLGVGGRVWAGATVASSPIFNIVARGWRFSGIEFTPGATSSAFTLTGTNANYFQVDGCSTWTGKYFLLNSGAHFARVYNNQVANLNAAGSIGIGSLAGVGGQMWDIRGNHFTDNYSHINFGSTRGLFGSRIEGNTFGGSPSVWIHPTVLLDLRNTSNTGGNMIVGNYFGCTATQYADGSSTAWVRTQAYDEGAGNMCQDGVAAAAIGH